MKEHLDENQQRQLAFFLTGRCEGPMLEPLDSRYRPALMARYKDLTSLRYDFPLILNDAGPGDRALISLSALVDEAVASISDVADRDRIAKQGHRIEYEIRRELEAQGSVDLAIIWNAAVERLAAVDDSIRSSADKLWAAFEASGRVVDVDADLPCRVITHTWRVVQREKARDFAQKAERLLLKLREILLAEESGSATGRAPERLRSGVGTAFSDTFDFSALSKILGDARPDSLLTDKRRSRIVNLIDVLENQRFYPHTKDVERYDFRFQTCSDALSAYNDRYDEAVRLLRTLAIADLEVAGDYREDVHDMIFEAFGRNGLSAAEMAKLPDYVICTNTANLDAAEVAEIIEILAAGRPFRILVATDDILERSKVGAAHTPLAFRSRQLVDTAVGLSDVFVFQSSAADLFRSRASVMRAASYDGAVLFSIYSGANDFMRSVPPYLAAAAATESRAFPTFVYDPSRADELAARLDISINSSVGDDWPTHSFVFEDRELQAHTLDLSFTLADFMAMDQRFFRHFAIVPDANWSDTRPTVAEVLDSELSGVRRDVPAIYVTDEAGRLFTALVDEPTIEVVRRSRTSWRLLRDQASPRGFIPPEVIADDGPATQAPVIPVESEPEADETPERTTVASDEAYIETPRCTTCNECTGINGRMFAYNSNKQAYIADPDAGTYRQLVEAAESCQVSIIHPGKPRNPKEPGLDELITRAEPFN